jgi:type IV fimbrial biogenesis protein FimT
MKTKSGQKGFTLIEVIIVIAIIGILSAVAIPGIMATIPRYRLRAEARELMINFKKAKVEAVKHHRDVVILFVDAPGVGPGGSYQMFVNMDRDPSPHTFDPGAGDISLVSKQVGTNIRLENNFTDDQAGYDNRGLPINLGSVKLEPSDGSRTYTLSASLTGNVRFQ